MGKGVEAMPLELALALEELSESFDATSESDRLCGGGLWKASVSKSSKSDECHSGKLFKCEFTMGGGAGSASGSFKFGLLDALLGGLLAPPKLL